MSLTQCHFDYASCRNVMSCMFEDLFLKQLCRDELNIAVTYLVRFLRVCPCVCPDLAFPGITFVMAYLILLCINVNINETMCHAQESF